MKNIHYKKEHKKLGDVNHGRKAHTYLQKGVSKKKYSRRTQVSKIRTMHCSPVKKLFSNEFTQCKAQCLR